MINFIIHTNPVLTLACMPTGAPTRRSLATAADLTGIHPDLISHYCRLGLLGADRAVNASEPFFDDNDLFVLRRIEHFRRHQGVNRQALPLICALEREVERLEGELRFLRGP